MAWLLLSLVIARKLTSETMCDINSGFPGARYFGFPGEVQYSPLRFPGNPVLAAMR
jgi:hypothetical protein